MKPIEIDLLGCGVCIIYFIGWFLLLKYVM